VGDVWEVFVTSFTKKYGTVGAFKRREKRSLNNKKGGKGKEDGGAREWGQACNQRFHGPEG